ncbi:GlsB/YeaQ/YmgE family stress response membrane protein [Corynebacterium lizhenjunii]|uniref:GlsB/YeaQ/YmgE family stress response membrane protein n=1 Tax=Corynebacterium lizhenjunii TaxID=2709394 RepID=A0A7T0PB48_9CORY|nr:GlsB/YeaQ/YmgE family stress response membrane protein [Corynebacterium lizhenjunii]QPK79050.1 GlsB/YeaQ/YmgE family stress response membrane protein [Corynebacterium lizhenjunii]
MNFFGWIIVGLVAGWLAEKIMDRDHGLFTNLIVGVVGAFIGGGILSLFGIGGSNGLIFSILTATLGAVVLLWILGLIKGKKATQ